MKQKKIKEDGEHEVYVTVTIAKASLTEHEVDLKKSDLPQVQNYFHCEYKLLPDDRDFIKTDVVTFGMAAKMYGDNDSKVLRTWLEGNKTWVAWTNGRKLRVTQDTLLKMFSHKVELKVWDTKDKVSAKARFDRPKAFRLPQAKAPDEIDLDIIRELLSQEGKTNVHLGMGLPSQSTMPTGNSINQQPSKRDISTTKSNSSHQFISTSDSKLEVQVRLDEHKQPQFNNLLALASAGKKPLAVDTVENDEDPASATTGSRKSSKNQHRHRKHSQRAIDSASSVMKKIDVEAERVRQNGLTNVTIPLSALFTNCTCISNNIKEPVSTLEEVIIIISLDKPLLSDRQRELLNPMVLTVVSASEMPDNTMSFSELKNKCVPPYVQYKFHESTLHKSEETEHGRSLKFNDRNVILLGVMAKGRLYEYLRGPPLKIEVHDRDPKIVPVKKSSVFGTRPHDEAINSVHYTGAVSSEAEDLLVDISYGLAEFDLSELLSGERILHLVSPIRNCHQSNSTNDKFLSKGNRSSGIPPGDYLEFGSELKVKIELARNLLEEPKPSVSVIAEGQTIREIPECPYNRMVYIFDYKNKDYLSKLLKKVTEINAAALQLSDYPYHVIEAALSTYKLSDEQKTDKALDIITGCQIIDGSYHIFILEGLRSGGIKELWDCLDHPPSSADQIFRVLYNSGMSFAQRLYISLDVDLTRVRLYQPLASIVKQPLLYVRDMIPKLCFDAVTKLFQLCECTSLHNAVRNEILPTAEMIVSLGKEFGVPLRPDDYEEIMAEETEKPSENSRVTFNENTSGYEKCKKRPPLDMTNEYYEKLLLDRKNGEYSEKNHVTGNIKSLIALAKSKPKKPEKQVISCDDLEVAHNYSSQKLNSTEMAKEKLRDKLASDPDSRFTFCQKYNSATLVPVAVDKLSKLELQKSRSEWKTMNGFIYPGMKSAIESNIYPVQLHPSRKEEIELPWRENVLHNNKIRPAVDWLTFNWKDRQLDFDVWKKPPAYFGKPAPVTIHAAGDTLAKEQAEFDKIAENIWKNKLVVDHPQFKTHRLLPATEMIDKGSKASNQQERVKDILKDDPQKYSLAKQKMHMERIPTVSVITHDNDASHATECDANRGFTPGENEGLSLTRDKNVIPVKDYQHDHFKKTKGYDFRLFHTDKQKTALKIKPLSEEERDTHLFCQ